MGDYELLAGSHKEERIRAHPTSMLALVGEWSCEVEASP